MALPFLPPGRRRRVSRPWRWLQPVPSSFSSPTTATTMVLLLFLTVASLLFQPVAPIIGGSAVAQSREAELSYLVRVGVTSGRPNLSQ